MGKYDNILALDRPLDPRHPPMSMHNRAAQFAPFDALTGFGGRIYEVSRLTQKQIELSEEEKQLIDSQLQWIEEHSGEQPTITITYFVPDKTKAGGSYQTATSRVMKIDRYDEHLLLEDELSITFDDILSIDACH